MACPRALGRPICRTARRSDRRAKLPRDAADTRIQGLFTYSLCQVLRQSHPSGFRELMQRVRGLYLAQGVFSPTPMIEGTELDRSAFRSGTTLPAFLLEEDAKGQKRIQAGQLHGFTRGSILAVREQPGRLRRDASRSCGSGESNVNKSRIPVHSAYQDHPAKANCPLADCVNLFIETLATTGCGWVFTTAAQTRSSRDAMRAALVRMTRREHISDPPPRKHGRCAMGGLSSCRRRSNPRLVVVARSEVVDQREGELGAVRTSIQFSGRPQANRIESSCVTIAKAEALLGLASTFGREEIGGLQLQYDVLYYGTDSAAPEAISLDRLQTLSAGGKLQFRLINRGEETLDFSLLFVDSLFGIQAIFPRGYAADNRLPPGKSFQTGPIPINSKTIGREFVLLIAVPAKDTPVSFAFLAQPTLLERRAENSFGIADIAQLRRVDQFLEFVAYRSGGTRGFATTSESTPVVRMAQLGR